MRRSIACLSVVAGAALLVALLPAGAWAGPVWQLKNPVGPQRTLRADLKAVCALDGGTAWAAGAGNAVYFTHDGGASWEAQATGAPVWTVWQALRFADMKHGLLAGTAAGRSLVYRTEDGGRTWAPVALPPYAAVADLEMHGPGLAWLVGARGLVLRSSDGGVSWQQARAGSADLSAVDFTSATEGVAVGAGGAVYRSSDGGRSWQQAAVPCRADLLDLAMRTPQIGWAVGRLGTVLSTSDGGRTWQRQWPLLLAGDLVAVDFASPTHGWAVSGAGALLVTADGGRSWRPEAHGMGAVRLRDVDAAEPATAAPERAFTAGDGGVIGAYTDSSWADNWVYLVPQGNSAYPSPATFTFELTAYDLTADQAYNGWKTQYFPATSEQPAMFGIDFMASRSNSQPPATWFNSYCNGVQFGLQTTTPKPADLNFAFTGTLTASGSYAIAFGQGHGGAGFNNWWVGSPAFSLQGTQGDPFLVTPDGAWQIIVGEGYSDRFYFDWQQ